MLPQRALPDNLPSGEQQVPQQTFRRPFLPRIIATGSAHWSAAPTGNVTAFLSHRPDSNLSGAKGQRQTQTYALIEACGHNLHSSTLNVVQVLRRLCSAITAIWDTLRRASPRPTTAACPTLVTGAAAGNSCLSQSFSGDYALLSTTFRCLMAHSIFTSPTRSSFTPWNTLGGISVLGPANAVLLQMASRYGSSALSQSFDQGTIDKLNGGPYTRGVFAVRAPVFSIYAQNGSRSGHDGVSGHRRDPPIKRGCGLLNRPLGSAIFL